MTDLTFEEYREASPEELRRKLREEAAIICGERSSDSNLVRAPVGYLTSHDSKHAGNEKCFFLRLVFGFLPRLRRRLKVTIHCDQRLSKYAPEPPSSITH